VEHKYIKLTRIKCEITIQINKIEDLLKIDV